MEADGPEWRTYMEAERTYAARVLQAIPGRDALALAIEHATHFDLVVRVQTAGEVVFMEVWPADGQTSRIVVTGAGGGERRVLIDPAAEATPGTHASIDWWQASPDGRHIVCGLSLGGTEKSTAHIFDTRAGRRLPERIDRTRFAFPAWAPDGSGFFYNRLPEGPETGRGSSCWFHQLETAPASDVLVLGPGRTGAVQMGELDLPGVWTWPASDLVVARVGGLVRREAALYVARLDAARAGDAAWRRLCGPEDQVIGVTVRGGSIFLLSLQGAPRGKVLKVDAAAPDIGNSLVVLPEGDTVIGNIAAARDGVYLQDSRIGIASLKRIDGDGRIRPIALPFEGAMPSLSARPDEDGAWIVLQGWVHPPAVCRVGPDGAALDMRMAPKPPIDVSPYVFERGFAPAKDGAQIPLSILYRRGLKRDGRAPLTLFVYGAYGEVEQPNFNAARLPSLDAGGVFVVAHVRGGGELGAGWHQAGQKLNKPNTWRDTIAAAEHLISLGYTSPGKLVVNGGSAGAIAVGRFITERPDLAAVAVIGVGVCNMLRMEFTPGGASNTVEFGSVKDPDGFRGLYEMDAYQHVVDGVRYPSVMLTTGLNDARVPPWQSSKMAARLRAATGSGAPVLLRLDEDAGHGGSTRDQWIRGNADLIAFTLWRTGDPRYQPQGQRA